MATDESFSTLEAIPDTPLPTDHGKQVIEVGIETTQAEKHAILQHNNSINVAFTQRSGPFSSRQIFRKIRHPWLWALGGLLLLTVVLVSVLGEVLSKKPHQTSTAANPTSSTLPKSSTNPLATPASSPSVQTEPNDTLQRAMAAFSYTQNGTDVYRMYFPDKNGQLVEATTLSNQSWVTDQIAKVESNSKLAAAVSRPGYPFEITVVYTDSNLLIHNLIYDSNTSTGNEGTLALQNYIAHPNSSLAVLYNQCRWCANTIIVTFQDADGFIKITNSTSAGWDLTEIHTNAFIGTSLALQAQPQDQTKIPNTPDQINLYHQSATLNISQDAWKPAIINNGIYGWFLNDRIWGTAPPGASLAVAAAQSNIMATSDWIQVLQSSVKGIEVTSWSNATNDWLSPQQYTPAVMSATGYDAMIVGAVAMTAVGTAFAVLGFPNGTNASVLQWQMREDLTDWSYVGTPIVWED